MRQRRDDSVYDFSTRAPKKSRQSSAKSASVLAAVFLFVTLVTIITPNLAHSASASLNETALAVSQPGFQNKAAHDIAIEIVKPGQEALELFARLSESSALIERDISWKLRDAQGAVVYQHNASIAAITVPPGDYTVEAIYGTVGFSQNLTLLKANRLTVSFVLDAGGIRVLPRVKGLGLPPTKTKSLVYSLSGHNKGKLVSISELPGEVLRVEAGDYRIESRFAAGNAVAVTDVHVKAGIMSAVEIDHAAGLAKLAYVGAPDAVVSWQVFDSKGEALSEIDGLSANVVLKPGSYIAKAQIGGELLTANFNIYAGQERDILLGN
jgi:hypothetical protein